MNRNTTRERNLDFDKVTNRQGTDCLKFDFAVQRGKPEGILPLWVADMDFPTSSFILDALQERVQHGIFGYTESGDRYFEAVSNWLKEKHGWEVKKEWLKKTPGVVFALAMAVKAYSKKGEGVLIQQPVYYPFSEVIRDNDRIVVSNDLVLGEDGRYHIDFVDFEAKITENNVHLFLLCNPHNPVGRVWTEEELRRMGDICVKHQVVIVSDEVHQDFVYGSNKHVTLAALSDDYENLTVTCTAPGKTFNIAGLQISNIFIPNEELRRKFIKEVDAAGYSQLNTLGIVGGEAAYRYGHEWYEAMLAYVESNIQYFKTYLEENIPQVHLIQPEGTYLLWVDCRDLHLSEEELEDLIINKANLWLDSGSIFGNVGSGFQRFNAACPRAVLTQALDQFKAAVDSLC